MNSPRDGIGISKLCSVSCVGSSFFSGITDRLPMDTRLPRATAKHDWALSHFKKLKQDITDLLDMRSYRVVPEFNDDYTEGELRLELDGAPERWGLMIGDCVHNLRSCLDHAVNELSVLHTGLDPPPHDKKLQFPILTDRTDKGGGKAWGNACDRYRIDTDHLSQRVIDVIEAAQPYHRTDDTWALRWIQYLDNTDKHRTLNPVAVMPSSASLELVGTLPIDGEGYGPTLIVKQPFVFQDHAVIGGFTSKVPCPDVRVKCELAIQIGLDQLPLPNGDTHAFTYEALFARMGNSVGRLLNKLRFAITP